MPIPFGGVIIHDDTRHTGSAKRNGAAGVAPMDADLAVFSEAINNPHFIGWRGPSHTAGGGLEWEGGDGTAALSSNAFGGMPRWNRIDVTKAAMVLKVNAYTKRLMLYYAPPGANPITWTLIAELGTLMSVRNEYAEGMVVKHITETVEVTAGNSNQNTVGHFFIIYKRFLGAIWEVTQQPGGGLNFFDIGPISDTDWVANNRPSTLGEKDTTMGPSATVHGEINPIASERFRVTGDANVTGQSLKVRITAFYRDLENSP